MVCLYLKKDYADWCRYFHETTTRTHIYVDMPILIVVFLKEPVWSSISIDEKQPQDEDNSGILILPKNNSSINTIVDNLRSEKHPCKECIMIGKFTTNTLY